jgi:hypothetical protein
MARSIQKNDQNINGALHRKIVALKLSKMLMGKKGCIFFSENLFLIWKRFVQPRRNLITLISQKIFAAHIIVR